jgi:hypothetical protein
MDNHLYPAAGFFDKVKHLGGEMPVIDIAKSFFR